MKATTAWPNEAQSLRLAHTARSIPDKKLEEIEQNKNVEPEHILKFNGGVIVPKAVTQDMGFGISFYYSKHYVQPAGSYFSTAHDLGRFCRMLLRNGELDGKRLLTEKAVKTMSSIQTSDVPVNPQEAYGVGVSVKIRDDEGPNAGSFGQQRGARRTAMWIDSRMNSRW